MMNIINAITFDLSKVDGNAITIFLIGFGVVFAALITIYFIFNLLPKVLGIKLKKEKSVKVDNATIKPEKAIKADDEVYAAIAMALSLHFEDAHDDEPMVLSINLNERLNSQWNSKIQNVNFYNN
ncbi:MAG: OadG family protein [Bacteroidales bacterium]|jgi:Na+-transporting methylmalonyl-CoA/oxaloacetate decarboxylase gamma subunit|nr:OadG family protein [Bacteroidales bacterium]